MISSSVDVVNTRYSKLFYNLLYEYIVHPTRVMSDDDDEISPKGRKIVNLQCFESLK